MFDYIKAVLDWQVRQVYVTQYVVIFAYNFWNGTYRSRCGAVMYVDDSYG